MNEKFFHWGECDDLNDDCQQWAKQGLCQKDPEEMHEMCPWSCHKCAPMKLGKYEAVGAFSGALLPLVLLNFASWLVPKTHATFSTNQIQNQNQSWFYHLHCSALHEISTLNFHWLTMMSTFAPIDGCDYIAFGFSKLNQNNSIWESALGTRLSLYNLLSHWKWNSIGFTLLCHGASTC